MKRIMLLVAAVTVMSAASGCGCCGHMFGTSGFAVPGPPPVTTYYAPDCCCEPAYGPYMP